MTGIPDDDWWRRRRVHYPSYSGGRPEPELTVTDNPIVATLLDHKGKPIRQIQERPPFGFRRNGDTEPTP